MVMAKRIPELTVTGSAGKRAEAATTMAAQASNFRSNP